MKLQVPVATAASVHEEIQRIFREEIGREGSVLGSHRLVDDLQLDSVNLLTLVVNLENRFRVVLEEEDTETVATVDDLVALILRRQGGRP